MSGTIIESFLFYIECFINQHLPYIDVVYDLWSRYRVWCCAYLLNVQAKFQNLWLKLVGHLCQWTHHQVTRSWPDESTWETINIWYVSWLDAIAKNIQLIMTLHVGQGDFKPLWTKKKDTVFEVNDCRLLHSRRLCRAREFVVSWWLFKQWWVVFQVDGTWCMYLLAGHDEVQVSWTVQGFTLENIVDSSSTR